MHTRRRQIFRGIGAGSLAMLLNGCAVTRAILPEAVRPEVAPAQMISATDAVALDPTQIIPMYKERLNIDLPAVAKVALSRNLDIQLARQRVEAASGQLGSQWGAAFPTLSPTALFENVDGTVRATQGNLTAVAFRTFQPFAFVQWVLNPGKVYFDIVAARKRLVASEYEERAVSLEMLRAAVSQYYDLGLAQAKVAVAYQALAEAEELLRLAQTRAKAGMGLAADEMRARAEIAGREQELILAIKSFYDASVTLSLTLNLDSTATLVPAAESLPKTTLVKEDLAIEDLWALAVEHRDDLKGVRALIEAATANRKSTLWSGVGPQVQTNYQGGGITGSANNAGEPPRDRDFGLNDQQRVTASASWKLGLSIFGDLKSTKAAEKQAYIRAERKLASIRAEVVRASQDCKAQSELISKSKQQVESAQEALRLTRANLQAGAMTTLDVLHAESVAAQARLRYSDAVVRYNQAQLNLLAGIGLLDERHLFGP